MQVRHLATLKHLQASCTSNHCAKLVLRGHVCNAERKEVVYALKIPHGKNTQLLLSRVSH